MSIPEPTLDDLYFQKIVNEARLRIHRRCPEWTDYNLSDPGITLIELFAWMTEMITFRLNQVPNKNHIRFLNMLGEELAPPRPAHALLTFYLSVPLPVDAADPDAVTVTIGSGVSIATVRSEEEPEIVFTVDRNPHETGPVSHPSAYLIKAPRLVFAQRPEEPTRNYWDVERNRINATLSAFSQTPQIGDGFYLGFDSKFDIRGYVLKLNFECENARGSGILREDPPWLWECWASDLEGGAKWSKLSLGRHPQERDTTGGLNYPTGAVTLHLPREIMVGAPTETANREAYWIRCIYKRRDANQRGYDASPRIVQVVPEVIGIGIPATHAQQVRNEFLGRSNGEPGQSFALQHKPVLSVGEVLEVDRTALGVTHSQKQWQRVPDFAKSDLHSRHFVLDAHTGEIVLGPNVPRATGDARQFGRVPSSGRELVVTQYQYGGGKAGNVPAGRLQELRTTLSYVDRVTNFEPAEGGADEEAVDEALLRLREHMWSKRAVAPNDFEVLAVQADSRVDRAKFVETPENEAPRGIADLRIVPVVAHADYAIEPKNLVLSDSLRRQVRGYLDDRRLLTTMLDVKTPSYVGVQIQASVRALNGRKTESVCADVARALRVFLCPLNVLPDPGAEIGSDYNALEKVLRQFLTPIGEDTLRDFRWKGWPFGRALVASDVQNLILQVPGVADVRDLDIYTARFLPSALPESFQWTLMKEFRMDLAPHELVCSFEHQIGAVK